MDEPNSDLHYVDMSHMTGYCDATSGAGTTIPEDVTCEACKKAAGL